VKTIWRAVLETSGPAGHKARYESHDCLSQADAEARAVVMGASARAVAIDFDEASGQELGRRSVWP